MRLFTLIFGGIGAFALLMILGVMFSNIVARALSFTTNGDLNWQISGARDAVKHGLIVLVFSCLPFLPQTGLIKVGLIADRFPNLLQHLLSKLWLGLLALLAGFAMVRFFELGQSQFQSGQTSQDLMIPSYLLSFYLSFCLLCLIISCGLKIIGFLNAKASSQ